MNILPQRGQIWLADLSPIRGQEQAGKRPVLIVSNDTFNQGLAGLIFVLPLTRKDRSIPVHIPIDPPEGGVTERSYILCDALRSISKDRLEPEPCGFVSTQTLRKVGDALRLLMDL